MRPGQQNNKRMRGRNRKGPNPLTRSFESNGGDVKIRGTALHIAEKYVQLSRDASSSGDRVAAENYLQHAEHYYRILAAAQAQMPQPQPVIRSDDDNDGDGDEEGDNAEAGANGSGSAAGRRARSSTAAISRASIRAIRSPMSRQRQRPGPALRRASRWRIAAATIASAAASGGRRRRPFRDRQGGERGNEASPGEAASGEAAQATAAAAPAAERVQRSSRVFEAGVRFRPARSRVPVVSSPPPATRR